MANQTSGNNNNDNNNNYNNSFNLNSSSSSQTNENITIPRANSLNQNFDTAPSLSQGFNNKNYSMVDSSNNINQKYNPALGQRKNNRNSDLAKSKLDNLDGKNNTQKNDNNSDSNHSGKDSSNDEHDPNKTDPNSSMLRHNDDNGINNTNNPYRSNNINNNLASDKDAESSKFRKSPINNNNSQLAKQVKNRIGSDNDNTNTSLSLLNSSFFLNSVMRKRIIIFGSIIVVVIIAILVFISILNALIAVISTSMCDKGLQNSSYFGSGDVLEFMCGMQSPLGDKSYTISSPAGEVRSYEKHPGIDLAIAGGTPIYAVQSGTIVRAGSYGGYGNCVDIDHGNGIVTRYGHMQDGSIKVSKGDIVNKGTRIGSVGTTGNSTGNHLHFEIIVNGKPVYDQNAYFDYRGTGGYEYRSVSQSFLKSCGSSVGASYVSTSSVTTISKETAYKNIKVLKTLSKSTGTIKYVSPKSGYAFQSFAYNNGYFYLQMIRHGQFGSGGYIYKYNSNLKKVDQSPSSQKLYHGNGLAYSTADNNLYSASTKYVGNNTHTRVVDSSSLKLIDSKKLLKHAAAIGYDRITNRFVTGLQVKDVYVYNSDLSDYAGKGHITKIRASGHPGDVAAYGGIIYITIWETVGNNHIDMYNEDTGEYLGSYEAPYAEIEGIDIDDSGQIVLLFHAATPFLQFTGIKANVINGSSDASEPQTSDQCCLNGSRANTTYTSTNSDYCPNGVTVTGKNAGTYELDDYIERVVTAENGGANNEALKALAIAARTYTLNRTDNCKNSIVNSTAAQVMAAKASDKVKNALQSVRGSIMLYNGKYFSAEYSSFLGTCSGSTCTSTFVKVPSSKKATFTIPASYVTINAGHDRGLSQNGSNYMASQGKTYDEILKFFYADGIEITGVSSSDNSCSLGGSGTYRNGKIWDYSQADYLDPYCGGTIADSGCGPTAMAMVVSTLLNEKHDPTELAKASKVCSTDKHTYFTEAAKKYGLKAVTTKDHEEVMTALNRGDSLVIANVTNATVDGLNNFWTEGGHYIVLAGHDGRDVWVQDPNKGIASVHRANTKGDGVYNFDKYIKPAATIGYIIIKRA